MSGDLISCSSPVLHGGNVGEARARRDFLRPELLAAPRADDDVGRAPHDLVGVDEALPRAAAARQLGKDVDPAGGLDQLRDPADAGDQRLIPFLEEHLRPARQRAAARRARPTRSRKRLAASSPRTRRRTHQRTQHSDHVENLGDRPLVEGVHVEAAANELGGDIGLQIGERQHEVGRERDDLVNIGRRERRDARLLAPRLGRPHDIAGDADDAILLAEQVQRLDGLLGQADDALRAET